MKCTHTRNRTSSQRRGVAWKTRDEALSIFTDQPLHPPHPFLLYPQHAMRSWTVLGTCRGRWRCCWGFWSACNPSIGRAASLASSHMACLSTTHPCHRTQLIQPYSHAHTLQHKHDMQRLVALRRVAGAGARGAVHNSRPRYVCTQHRHRCPLPPPLPAFALSMICISIPHVHACLPSFLKWFAIYPDSLLQLVYKSFE